MLLPLLGLAAMLSIDDPMFAGFKDVPNDARMRMYWRVFGPAWETSEIDDQLDKAKAAGLGGLVAYFMYPVALDDPTKGIHNQRFGSPEFLKTFAYAASAAERRGLRFGVNGGTGWPYGGATVSPDDAAKKLREVVSPSPVLQEGERLIASSGDHHYIESPTGQKVKRAAFGAEGLVLDHFDTPALVRWLEQNVEPLVKAGRFETLGCDSLEVYSANWASDLPREFAARRGYDVLPNLPKLFGDPSSDGKALRFDYWRTLMEMTEERFTRPLSRWTEERGMKLEMEAYGTPPNPMTAYRYIHVPTGEHYEWRGFSVQKFVSSAAHINAKNVVGSEAWTWIGLPNRLADTLSDIKLCSDMTFLAGCNDLTGVDYPYSPRSVGQPGWQPYYGPTMSANNPQWVAFPGLVEYLNRCQWMLRQGRPKVTVAVYLPVEDALSTGGMDQMLLDFLVRDRFVTGSATSEFGLRNALKHRSALLQGIFAQGFDYDGIDLWAVDRIARVAERKMTAGTSDYEAVVLPFLETMDLKAALKVKAFCERGGVVVASRHVPRLPAGRHSAEEYRLFNDAISAIFGRSPVAGKVHPCGVGKGLLVAEDDQVGEVLSTMLTPQVRMSPIPETIGFCQRATAGRDVFFFANVDSVPHVVNVRFPRSKGMAQRWDAKDGRAYELSPEGEGYRLDLDARGSAFVVVGRDLPAMSAQSTHSSTELEWNPRWKISFEGPDPPPSLETNELLSWTRWPGGRYFSGIGVYETDLEWSRTGSATLSFDGLHDGAKVLVNGGLVGYVFSPPWRLDIGPFLHQGRNTVRIEVGNLPVNRFIGLPDQDLGALRAVFGNRFPAPEEKQMMKEPALSGIVGRVRLLVGGA